MDKKTMKKKSAITWIYVLGSFLVVAICISIYFGVENKKVYETLSNSYDQSLFELTEYVDNLEALLAKAQITSTWAYSAKTFSNIWRKADLAATSVSQIPINNNTLGTAMKFFNQLSDYSYSLSNKLIDGVDLTDEDFKNIEKYYETCKTLNVTLQELSSDLMGQSISWKELSKSEEPAFLSQEVDNISKDSFSKIDENMQDYEGLIYDGPFSEHMTSLKPMGLGDEEVTEEQAKEIALEYVKEMSVTNLQSDGIVDGQIKAYSFSFDKGDDSRGNISITVKGGKLLWLNIYREIGEEKISYENATKIARDFLENKGFLNMHETYFMNEGGVLTINYAYNQDGIICYTDLVKVKVALDNGEIFGMETASYLNSHHQRKIPNVQISMQDAMVKLNPKLEISSQKVTVIPTKWKTEVTAYEFKGKMQDRDFLVYINVEDGKEENIFLLLETPGGSFTI